jgi:hypothetical protein
MPRRPTRAGIVPYPSSVIIRLQIGGFALCGISNARALILQKESKPMKSSSDLANKGIERILELSADAHIRRRGTATDSPEFHKLTGAIVAYGKTLAVLTALQEREEFYEMLAQLEVFTSAHPVC